VVSEKARLLDDRTDLALAGVPDPITPIDALDLAALPEGGERDVDCAQQRVVAPGNVDDVITRAHGLPDRHEAREARTVEGGDRRVLQCRVELARLDLTHRVGVAVVRNDLAGSGAAGPERFLGRRARQDTHLALRAARSRPGEVGPARYVGAVLG